MASHRWTLKRVLPLLAIACAGLAFAGQAGAASADAPHSQLVGGAAPGGDDLAVIGGVPHVAWTDAQGVHVARLDTAPGPWHAVGAPFRHAPGSSGAVADASLASDPAGRPWVAWTEVDGADTSQVRVARFDGTAWHEVVGGAHPLNPAPYPGYESINDGSQPQLTFYGGVPYVAWLQDEPGELQTYVSRLKADGSAWQRIPMLADARGPVRLVVSGGRLFVAWRHYAMAAPEIRRLNVAGTGWDNLDYPPGLDYGGRFGDIADVQGVFHVLYRTATDDPPEVRVVRLLPDDSYAQVGAGLAHGEDALLENSSLAADGANVYAARVTDGNGMDIQRYAAGAWQPLAPPETGAQTDSVRLAPAASGGMWLLYSRISGGATTWRLAGYGVTLPEPSGGGNGGGNGGGDGGGNPSGPPEPPAGVCASTIEGTALADRLVGTRRSEGIFGRGGNDEINGRGASDCLYGGSGNDLVFGGRGNDFFRGGAGNDRIYGGVGNDDINGDRGNDRIVGGPGNDVISAGRGNDTIYVARQGSDVVECGPGRDTVVISLEDGHRHCERVIVRR